MVLGKTGDSSCFFDKLSNRQEALEFNTKDILGNTAVHEYKQELAELKRPEHTVSKLSEMVIFNSPLPTFQSSAISATIFHENMITGNIWLRVHGQLWQLGIKNNKFTQEPFSLVKWGFSFFPPLADGHTYDDYI